MAFDVGAAAWSSRFGHVNESNTRRILNNTLFWGRLESCGPTSKRKAAGFSVRPRAAGRIQFDPYPGYAHRRNFAHCAKGKGWVRS